MGRLDSTNSKKTKKKKEMCNLYKTINLIIHIVSSIGKSFRHRGHRWIVYENVFVDFWSRYPRAYAVYIFNFNSSFFFSSKFSFYNSLGFDRIYFDFYVYCVRSRIAQQIFYARRRSILYNRDFHIIIVGRRFRGDNRVSA